jgi:hypothetical protein
VVPGEFMLCYRTQAPCSAGEECFS